MAESARNPDALQQEIERTRDQLARTADIIAERVSPQNLMQAGTKQLQETRTTVLQILQEFPSDSAREWATSTLLRLPTDSQRISQRVREWGTSAMQRDPGHVKERASSALQELPNDPGGVKRRAASAREKLARGGAGNLPQSLQRYGPGSSSAGSATTGRAGQLLRSNGALIGVGAGLVVVVVIAWRWARR